jgi:hypothetical protein
MVWQKNFDPKLTDDKVELFGSFFSAIQNFAKEIVVSGRNEINNINMGTLELKVTNIDKLNLELITIADAIKSKEIGKFHIEVVKTLLSHKEIFFDWDGDVGKFKALDHEIELLYLESKLLSGEDSLVQHQRQILDTIWGVIPDLEPSQKQAYLKERDYLYAKFKSTSEILKKFDILQTIDNITSKIRDAESLQQVQQQRKKLLGELKTAKEHFKHYLAKTKESLVKATESLGPKSLDNIKFNEVYLNLYSFATKLRLLGNVDLAEEYKKLATGMLEKSPEVQENLSQVVHNILNLSEDICDFIPRPYCEV